MQQTVRNRVPIPDAVANKPQLHPGLEFAYMAFCDLNTERSVGMAVGPIPRSKVIEYAQQAGVDDMDDAQMLWMLVKRVDSGYLEHVAKRK